MNNNKKNTDIAEKEIQTILKKHKLRYNYHISFPMYRQLPDEVKLAMSVLSKHGMKITVNLAPIEGIDKKGKIG